MAFEDMDSIGRMDFGDHDGPSIAPRSTPFDPIGATINGEAAKWGGVDKFAQGSSKMATTMAKKVPILGGLYTGAQTTYNNPAQLGPFGRVMHGMMTGGASIATPPMVGLADGLSGNHMANGIEDVSGAWLKQFQWNK